MKEDLWQGRRLRLLLSPDSPVWAHGKVSKIEQVENDGIFVEMEFEAETPKKMQQLGTYVDIIGLVQSPQYNGSRGVVVADDEFVETGRYSVQVRDVVAPCQKGKSGTTTTMTTTTMKILPKNLVVSNGLSRNATHKWKIQCAHSISGGTLVGNENDCAPLLSFEWLEPSAELPSTVMIDDDRLFAKVITTEKGGEVYEEGLILNNYMHWIGTSGYFTLPDGKRRIRLNDGNNSSSNRLDIFPDGKHRIGNDSSSNRLEILSFIRSNGKSSTTTIDATANDPISILGRCPVKSLPRMKILPMPSQRMVPRVSNKQKLKYKWLVPTYNRFIHDGIFEAEWIESPNSLTVSFFIVDDGDDNSNDTLLRKVSSVATFRFTEYEVISAGSLKISFVHCMEKDDSLHVSKNGVGGSSIDVCKELKEVMTQDQQQYFCTRLLHGLLRQQDSILLSQLRMVSPVKLLREVHELYTTRDLNKQNIALDVKVLEADWTYNNHALDCGPSCNDVGETLEAMGKFSLAGEVYAEAAQHFEPKFTLTLNAGLAFKRVNDCEKAERFYVTAMQLYAHGKADDDKIGSKKVLFDNIICNYEHWWDLTQSDMTIMRVVAVLSALLYTSGWEENSPHISAYGQARTYILKKKYLSQFEALQTINEIIMFKSSSVQDFRTALLACLKDPELMLGCKNLSSESDLARNKKAAREQLRMRKTTVEFKCDNCGDMVETRKQCPCGTVTYCGRDCQKKAWSKHKKVCPIVRK